MVGFGQSGGREGKGGGRVGCKEYERGGSWGGCIEWDSLSVFCQFSEHVSSIHFIVVYHESSLSLSLSTCVMYF